MRVAVSAAEAFLAGRGGEPQFWMDRSTNFILGASYEQEDIPPAWRGQPDEVVAAYCKGRCVARGAAGFFFQQHTNDHEIVGFYATVAAMEGERAKHGHARGFLCFAESCLEGSGFTVDPQSNFVTNAPYEQIDLPAHAKNRALPVTLAWCAAQAKQRGAHGFFFQEHTANGHEIVGFYATADAVAQGERGWHGHARGFVAIRAEPAPEPMAIVDGVALGETHHADGGWVCVVAPTSGAVGATEDDRAEQVDTKEEPVELVD